MSDKNPRDDIFDSDMEQELRFPGQEPDDLTEDERNFTFDENYLEEGKTPAGDPYSDQVALLASAMRTRQEREMQSRQERAEKVDALAEAFKKQAKAGSTDAKTPVEQTPDRRSNDKESEKPKNTDVAAKASGEPESYIEPESHVPVAFQDDQIDPRPKKTGKTARRKNQQPLMVRRQPDAVTIGRELKPDEMLVYDSELDDIDYTDDEDLPEMRDYLPIRFRRYGRLGIGGGIMYALFVISVSIILACLGWLFASDVLALNKDPVSAIVTIEEYVPQGDDPVVNEEGNTITVDIDQVATELKNAGMIEYKWLFKLYSQFSHADTKIDPGTYDVSTELDYRALVTALQFGSGNQEVTRITFPEGYTLEQVFALLEENHISRVTDLYESMDNSDFDFTFLEDIPSNVNDKLEGYLFPDTYDFYQGESADVAIRRFLRNLNSKFTESMRVNAENRGLTVHEVLTMASLIEKEAGSVEEMPTIASVIYNRLNSGMHLQLDTTINYIMGTNTLNVTIEDTEIDDPYNTYLYEGLPPGPICNPGMAAIEAVLYPESTDYWYWYAYEGENYFFTTYDEFNAFIEAHPIPGEEPAEGEESPEEEETPAADEELPGEELPAEGELPAETEINETENG